MFNLERQGFITYLPKHEKPNLKLAPLFPTYLFLRVPFESCPWLTINSTYGVRHVLTDADGKPQPIADRIIQDIQKREDDDGIVSMDPEIYCDYEPGQRIKVTHGTRYWDTKAIFKCPRGFDRAVIMLSLMGRDSEDIVPMEAIRGCA